ncbi:ATP-binding cassette domain-containing protein [Enterococcus sp. AZ050]|uniref:ATP-binding cassette domain-containing protein n=1 Tax=Enterococcus sp. AZ050 TaxID=2774696 RepID=UPI003F281C43
MRLIVDIQKELKSHTLQIQFETKTQTTGILGASGCGKSMLLKCIAGVETADKGQIVLNDQVLFDAEQKINLSPQQRKIGLLFQQYALFPHLSVVENLTFVTKDLQLVTQLLASFHLTKVQQQYPSQLSGGQRQRVAFARMLAAQPAYLLLDEPFSALDAPLKEELQIELQQRLSNLNQHALIVSHSLDELYKLCQSLVIITKKQTLFGATNQLFNQPQTIEAAKLTGCKNIWPVKRIDAHRVQVIGWQQTLTVTQEVPISCHSIGIRAHDFTTEPQATNQIEVHHLQTLSAPFEQSAWFQHQQTKIWWKGSNRLNPKVITQLSIPPTAIMPLCL